ncbi:MAG: hypothetical protein HY791_12625 [Deltaproteobacteria bacterium]|nr:hypothetical protein [Deltaproteobacteria bacterium]
MSVVFIISMSIAPIAVAISIRRRTSFVRSHLEIATTADLRRYRALASSDGRLGHAMIVLSAISVATVPIGFLSPWEALVDALLAWAGGLFAGSALAFPFAIWGTFLDRRVWRLPVRSACRPEFAEITRQWRTSSRPVDPPVFFERRLRIADSGQLSVADSGMLAQVDRHAEPSSESEVEPDGSSLDRP